MRISGVIASIALSLALPIWSADMPAGALVATAAAAAEATTPDFSKLTGLESGRTRYTKGEARARIEGKGFTRVGSLQKGEDGIWRGTARREGKDVLVGIDHNGKVASAE